MKKKVVVRLDRAQEHIAGIERSWSVHVYDGCRLFQLYAKGGFTTKREAKAAGRKYVQQGVAVA